MKLLLLTVTIGLVGQLTSAATLQRSKRSDPDFLKDFELVQTKHMEFLPTTADVFKATLAKIPKNEEFKEHREEIEEFVSKLEEFKADGGKCLEKSSDLQKHFIVVMLGISVSDDVKQWFKESGGDKIKAEMDKIIKIDDDLKIDERLKDAIPLYRDQWQEIVEKSCK